MSHTTRRRKDHTAHKRGHFRQALAAAEQQKHRPPVAPKPEPPRVTDHALVRWMERVLDVDVRSKIEADMLADGRADLIRTVGSGRIRVRDSNIVLVIHNGIVITVHLEQGDRG